MNEIRIPPYLPLVAQEAIKKLEEKLAAAKAANAGKLLLDKPVSKIRREKPSGR